MNLLDELVSVRSACPPEIPMEIWLRSAECVEAAVAAVLDMDEAEEATGTLHLAIARALLSERFHCLDIAHRELAQVQGEESAALIVAVFADDVLGTETFWPDAADPTRLERPRLRRPPKIAKGTKR